MTRLTQRVAFVSALASLGWIVGCSDSDDGDGPGGSTGGVGAAGGAIGTGGASSNGGSSASGGGGNTGVGGASTGGVITGGGGASGAGGGPGDGGASSGGGTAGAGGGDGGTAGAGGGGGTAGAGGGTPGTGGSGPALGCGKGNGAWPASDPSKKGPYEVTTENNVGPNSAYTMFRPATLGQAGLKHPVITWGNGTGTTPSTYRGMLTHYASHGFVVIAANSSNVAQGNPPPMLDGVTWVLAQAEVSSSPLYGCIDAAKIGATGHSQGALATTSASSDPRIATIAPIEGARANRGLHGPAAFFCGGMDTTLPCSGHTSAFNGVTGQPAMLANQLNATHTNWIGGFGGTLNPFAIATTGWFRVHLMGDTALRSMFYGADCTLCKDTATWQIQRKMMD